MQVAPEMPAIRYSPAILRARCRILPKDPADRQGVVGVDPERDPRVAMGCPVGLGTRQSAQIIVKRLELVGRFLPGGVIHVPGIVYETLEQTVPVSVVDFVDRDALGRGPLSSQHDRLPSAEFARESADHADQSENDDARHQCWQPGSSSGLIRRFNVHLSSAPFSGSFEYTRSLPSAFEWHSMHDATLPAIAFCPSFSEVRAIEPSGRYFSQYQSPCCGSAPLDRYITAMSFSFLSLS